MNIIAKHRLWMSVLATGLEITVGNWAVKMLQTIDSIVLKTIEIVLKTIELLL